MACRKAALHVNTGIFAGSIVIFCVLFCHIRLLDTLDHFDYDFSLYNDSQSRVTRVSRRA